jgi:hypothetical protein
LRAPTERSAPTERPASRALPPPKELTAHPAPGIDDAPATDGTPIGEAVAVGDDIMEEHIFCIIWPAAFWPVCFAALSAARHFDSLYMGEEFGVDCPAQTHCMVEICGHRKQRATPYDILRAPR